MKMRLSHKIIVGFVVLVLLSGVFGTSVFYMLMKQIMAAAPSPSPELEQIAAKASQMVVIIGVLTVILGVLIAFVVTKQIVTPIQAINLALAQYVESGKAVRVNVPNKDELGILAMYVNKIIGGS